MDAPLIVQVLLNLLENAIKYTPDGSHVLIRAQEEDQRIHIDVLDDGPGISDENKEHCLRSVLHQRRHARGCEKRPRPRTFVSAVPSSARTAGRSP